MARYSASIRLTARYTPHYRSCRVLALLVGLPLACVATAAPAQARPGGAGRAWGELALGGASQAPRCASCARKSAAAGPVLSAAAGVTLPRGFGLAVLGRAFQEVNFEHSQTSRYVVALGQYAPPGAAALTLSAGAGWGRHRGDSAPYANDGEGAVLAAGVALRLPARPALSASLTADLLQAVGGATAYRPRQLTVGLGLNVATPTRR